MHETETTEAVDILFHPKSVAVIGASQRKGALGERLVRYLLKHGYKGKVFPVNPRYDSLMELPCFPSLSEIPEPVDLALIALPAEQVLATIEQCVDKHVKVATIFAGGFAESGPEGRELQEKVKDIARKGHIRICGPNTVGTFNIKDGIAASFSQVLEGRGFAPGNIGIVAQSGGLAGSLLDRAHEKGLGVNYVASCGNEVDLESSDYISYMLDDPDTRVIMAFIEGFRNGPKFADVATKALGLGKPLVILKVGRTERGKKAAASHTGSLTGSDAVYSSIFKQLGIIRVEDIDQLVDAACFLSWQELQQGNRLGILSPSGGAGILIADKCEQYELELPDLTAETTEKLSTLLPSFGVISNPLDPTGQSYANPNQLTDCIQAFAEADNFDVVLVQAPTIAGDFAVHFANGIVQAAKNCRSPLAVLCTGGSLSAAAVEVLRANKIPFFHSFDSCFKAIGLTARYVKLRNERAPEDGVLKPGVPRAKALRSPQLVNLLQTRFGALTEYESKLVLLERGLPCTREGLARSPEEAASIARQIGFPVAMKVQSPDILHKTEARVIRLGVSSETEVLSLFGELQDNARRWDPRARVDGVLVQEMVDSGVETIAGISSDPTFGPVILFGLGGVFAEILKDVAIRVAPLTRRDAECMINEIKGFPILQGARGGDKSDVDALADTLMKISDFAIDNQGSVSQLDVNPLVVFKSGGLVGH
ncbi:MAG: acetate--CoA ligase family protein [Chloroflexi bacterium]|nr:acetate--CoA ligase family protein [Chloroflexota bacterium]